MLTDQNVIDHLNLFTDRQWGGGKETTLIASQHSE